MGFFDIFKPRKKVASETERREFLLTKGRVAEATIIDNEVSETGAEIAYYYYNIQGVDFESSEILTAEQRENSIKYAPGAKISIRFDPKNHGNSIIV